MRKGKKTAIIVSMICILAGLGIMLGSWLSMDEAGRDEFGNIGSKQFTTIEYILYPGFNSISIQTIDSSVRVLPASDGICRVVCDDTENIFHEVTVEKDTLSITQIDARKWYEAVGFFWYDDPYVTVYLPDAAYGSLELESSSGDLSLKDVTSDSLEIDTSSGNIELDNVIAAGKLRFTTLSGDIAFSGTDAAEIEIETSSGNVSGTLLSAKRFLAETSSGNVDIPASDPGAGAFQVTTASGDIMIVVEDREERESGIFSQYWQMPAVVP